MDKFSIIRELSDFLHVVLENDKFTPISRYKGRLFRMWLFPETGIEWIVATFDTINDNVKKLILNGTTGKIRVPKETFNLIANERLFIIVDIVYDSGLERAYKKLCEVEKNEKISASGRKGTS